MKKLLSTLLVVLSAAMIMSCNKEDPTPTAPTLTLSPAQVTLGDTGTNCTSLITSDSETLAIEVAAADKSWLGAQLIGKSIAVTALGDNEGTAARKGSVVVTAGKSGNQTKRTLTVTQNRKGTPPVSLFAPTDPVLLNVVDDELTVSVSAAADKFTFAIPEADQSWLAGTKSGATVVFKVKTLNQQYAVRTSKVVFTFTDSAVPTASAVLNVSQKGVDVPSLTIANSNVTLGNAADSSADVIVETNQKTLSFNYNDNSWLSAAFNSETGKITVTATTKNAETKERTGKITVSVGSGEHLVAVDLNVTQEASAAGSYPKVGDSYDKDGVKGVIFWVDAADPSKAKIVSINRLGPANWCTDVSTISGGVTGALNTFAIPNTSDTDGTINTTAITAFAASVTSPANVITGFTAYQYCLSEGEGWYNPSIGEWQDIITGYYGAASFDAIPEMSPSAMIEYTPADATNPDEIDMLAKCKAAIAARDKFETNMTALGGVKINASEDTVSDGDTYLSSSQSTTATQVGYVCTGKRRASNAAKFAKSPKRYTRCIKQVTLVKNN